MARWKIKILAAGFLLFVGLWVVGVARNAAVAYPEPISWEYVSVPSERYQTRQIANNFKEIGIAGSPLPKVIEEAGDHIQLFEKRAQIGCRSQDFQADESKLRSQLALHKAIVFFEKSEGTAPRRKLYIELNVPPEQFESLVAGVKTIGHLESILVQQRDRTSEFRKLQSQRRTMRSHLDAIVKLRDRPMTSLDDALKLENKIIDIERDLQNVGVQMGDLAAKESYFHVDMSLIEYQPGGRLDPTYTWPQRIALGLFFAIVWWFVLAVAAAVLVGVALSVRVLTK